MQDPIKRIQHQAAEAHGWALESSEDRNQIINYAVAVQLYAIALELAIERLETKP